MINSQPCSQYNNPQQCFGNWGCGWCGNGQCVPGNSYGPSLLNGCPHGNRWIYHKAATTKETVIRSTPYVNEQGLPSVYTTLHTTHHRGGVVPSKTDMTPGLPQTQVIDSNSKQEL